MRESKTGIGYPIKYSLNRSWINKTVAYVHDYYIVDHYSYEI